MDIKTSERHSDFLNEYINGDSRAKKWFHERHTDFVLTDWSPGRVSMVWSIGDEFLAPDGVMFGGQIAFVADHVCALAAYTVLGAEDDRFRTSRLETNFFRPLTKCDARIEAQVVNVSKNLIHIEGEIFNAQDKCAARISAVQMRRKA